MIPALDPDPESDFQFFGDFGSGFRSNTKWNHITSTLCYQNYQSIWCELSATCLPPRAAR